MSVSVPEHGEPLRRLLVITYHFPPDGSVGGLRWGGISKYLVRRGWEVHVVTASPRDGETPPPGVHVHYCPVSRTLNDVYNQWARRVRATSGRPGDSVASVPGSAEAIPPAGSDRAGFVGRARRNLATGLAFPDYGRGWILPAARAARALLRQRRFDAVVTSGPPHSAHLAGVLACRRHRGLLWVDMRDPWSAMIGATWAQSAFRSDWVRYLIPRLERFVFRHAGRVVTNTAEFADELRGTFPHLSVSFVPNGIDPARLPPAPRERFPGLSIIHAGSLYAGRDLSTILLGMRAFLVAYPAARDALTLRLAGSMDAHHEARFRDAAAAADLASRVEVLGRVPGAEAMALISRSHLALVLAQDQPMQVPAKLYESVAMGVRTLVIGESSSAAAREARRIGAVALEASDIEGVTRILEEIWLDRTPAGAPRASIGYDDIAVQMDALLRGASAAAVGRALTTPIAAPRT